MCLGILPAKTKIYLPYPDVPPTNGPMDQWKRKRFSRTVAARFAPAPADTLVKYMHATSTHCYCCSALHVHRT